LSQLGRILLKGLVTILPIGLTVYLVYWLGVTTESLLSGPIRWFIPDAEYVPGMGLVAGFIVLFLVGLLVNAYVVRRVIRYGESLLERIPVVETIYGAFKDVTRFLPEGGKSRDLKRVVTWRWGTAHVIGFVTEDHVDSRSLGMGEADVVAVYFPMSYQIGGYTLYLPKDELETLDMPVETAMRMVLTGAMSTTPVKPARRG